MRGNPATSHSRQHAQSARRVRAGARVPVLVAVAVLVASTAAELAGAAPPEVVVSLTGSAVGRVEVAAGGVVHFRADSGSHLIEADDASWSTGYVFEGQTVSLEFKDAGEFPFHCKLHPGETGVIAVIDDAAPPPPPPPPPENQPPAVSILDPAEGAEVSGAVTVRVAVSDSDGPGPLAAEVSVDGGAWAPMSQAADGSWEWAWDAAAAGEGEHVLSARGLDGAQAGPAASVRVVVVAGGDPEPPTPPPDDEPEPPEDPPAPGNERPIVRIDGPESGARVPPSDVPIVGTAEDPDGSVTRVEVSIDGGEWKQAIGTGEWAFFWSAEDAAPGEHVIRVRAFDGTSYSMTAKVTVQLVTNDGFKPPTPGDSPPAVSDWRETALNVGWIAIAVSAVVGAWAWASSRP